MKSVLRIIMGKETKVVSFQCEKCPFETRHKCSLRLHVKSIHQKINDLICQLCGYSTTYETNLDRHIKVHHLGITGKKYSCGKCSYATHISSNFESHKLIHREESQDRPRVNCMMCDTCEV